MSACLRDVLLTWGESALTVRERVVLSRIADGKSTKAIAQELGLSPRTVEVHRLHLLRKLEAHSSAELVRNAIRRGLLIA